MLKSKIPFQGKALSRWKQIIIHDDNHEISSVYNLDERQRLEICIKQPKRKNVYQQMMKPKMPKNKRKSKEKMQKEPKTTQKQNQQTHQHQQFDKYQKSKVQSLQQSVIMKFYLTQILQ